MAIYLSEDTDSISIDFGVDLYIDQSSISSITVWPSYDFCALIFDAITLTKFGGVNTTCELVGNNKININLAWGSTIIIGDEIKFLTTTSILQNDLCKSKLP